MSSFASSYIKTTVVAVTRNADNLKAGIVGNIKSANGTIALDFVLPLDLDSALIDDTRLLRARNGSGDAFMDVYLQGADVIRCKRFANFNVSGGGNINAGDVGKISVSWVEGVSDRVAGSLQGAPVSESTTAFSAIAETNGQIQIGSYDGSSFMPFCNIKNLRIYNKALSDAQMIALTS